MGTQRLLNFSPCFVTVWMCGPERLSPLLILWRCSWAAVLSKDLGNNHTFKKPMKCFEHLYKVFIFFIQVEQEIMFKNVARKRHKQCNKAIWRSVRTRTSSQVFIMQQGEYFMLCFLFKSLLVIKWLRNQTKPNLKTALGGTWRLWLSFLLTREDTEPKHYPKSLQPVSSKTATSLANELSRFWGWHIWVSMFLQTCRWSLSLCFICLCCEYSKSLSCQHVSQIKWTQELKLNQPWKVIWGR